MSEKTENVKALVESLSPEELRSLSAYLRSKLPEHPLEKKWRISYELILEAIHRSQDIVQRGVRGVIAEAVFAKETLPRLKGWHSVAVLGDLPYDFKIQQGERGRTITIQVKLQRTEGGRPLTRKTFGDAFIVEVQKTRSGAKRPKKGDSPSPAPQKTRPYQFGDFDVLAVNMQPSTQDWTRFMYTVGSWLMRRAGDKKLIEIMQPVSPKRSDVWTDSLEECIGWLLSGNKKVVFDMVAARKKLKQGKAKRVKDSPAVVD